MAIQTELGVVREIAAELQKEGTEVVVHGIDVVLVDHGGGADQPGIRCASLRVIAPLGPHHGRPFLGLADVDHSLLAAVLGQIARRHLIFPLPLGETDQRHSLLPGELLQARHERRGDRFHQHRGDHFGAALLPEETMDTEHVLQLGHVHVEVQAVDTFHFQDHMLSKHAGHRPCFAHLHLCSRATRWRDHPTAVGGTARRSFMQPPRCSHASSV